MSGISVDSVPAPAFGLSDELPPLCTAWHKHARHQILYAVAGVMHLDVDRASFLLPPRRAAFLSAGTQHRVRCDRPVSLRTVYVTPDLIEPVAWDCLVFTVSPLLREMMLSAMRWDHKTDPSLPLLRPYFVSLSLLVLELCENAKLPFRLPVPSSDELRRVTQFVRDNLGRPIGVCDLAKAAALSERTLRRRFQSDLGMSPHDYLHAARILAAMERLSDPQQSITMIGLSVGFESSSAFSHAFASFVGETPRDYRKRALATLPL